MQFDAVIAGAIKPLCSRDEVLLDFGDFAGREFANGFARVRIIPRRRAHRLGIQHGALQQTATMAELPEDKAIFRFDGVDETREARNEAIVKGTERVAVVSCDIRRHHGLGHHHGHAASRALDVIAMVAIAGDAVRGRVIRAHRRQHQAVLELERSDIARLRDLHRRGGFCRLVSRRGHASRTLL